MNENEIVRDNTAFVGYDYMEVVTSPEKVSFLMDSYENFGWIVDGNISSDQLSNKRPAYTNVILRLKRDRKIVNKTELTRLQRNFESCIKEIDQMEKSKTSSATMYALIIGITGTAFMAGSVFAVTAEPPKILLCTILAIPAFLGWILPYFTYKNIVKVRSEKVEPFIEKKRDEIYELCEKGNKLLL